MKVFHWCVVSFSHAKREMDKKANVVKRSLSLSIRNLLEQLCQEYWRLFSISNFENICSMSRGSALARRAFCEGAYGDYSLASEPLDRTQIHIPNWMRSADRPVLRTDHPTALLSCLATPQDCTSFHICHRLRSRLRSLSFRIFNCLRLLLSKI